jgi:hypothetical protein
MPRLLATTFTMMSHASGQAPSPSPPPLPPPPSPPPQTDIPDSDEFDENEATNDGVIDVAMNAQFMADTEREAENERAAHAAFDAE